MAEIVEITKVEGLDDFARALGKVDRELAKTLRVVLNDAADPVVEGTRRRFAKQTGRAARTIKAQSTRKEVRVKEGGKRAPYAPWLDFGGSVGRNNSVTRPYRREGRYLFKVYGEKRDAGEFTKMLDEGLQDVARRAGLTIERGDG